MSQFYIIVLILLLLYYYVGRGESGSVRSLTLIGGGGKPLSRVEKKSLANLSPCHFCIEGILPHFVFG